MGALDTSGDAIVGRDCYECPLVVVLKSKQKFKISTGGCKFSDGASAETDADIESREYSVQFSTSRSTSKGRFLLDLFDPPSFRSCS